MAGPLDAIAWVGGEGRAIAKFGTRGNRYRPEHEDPFPTLAMIDVSSRRILDTLTAADAHALRVRAGSYNGFGLLDVSAVQLRNGRLRALFPLGRAVDDSHEPAMSACRKDDLLPQPGWFGLRERSQYSSQLPSMTPSAGLNSLPTEHIS
jgi:hypothetical protein